MHPTHHPNPVALITGGSAGIGRAIAIALAQRGWTLALVARGRQRLEQLANELAPSRANPASPASTADPALLLHAADLAHPGAPSAMIAAANQRFGRIDALINNAGVAPLLPIPDTTDDAIDRCIAINLRAPLIAIRDAWPIMARTATLPGALPTGPIVINISTMATRDPFPGFFAYAASKAGVNLAARSIANEGHAHHIRAITIAPGAVETDMLRALFPTDQLPPHACLNPNHIAQLAIDCIDGHHDTHLGQTLFITQSPSGTPTISPA